jgi:hypothetical protein
MKAESIDNKIISMLIEIQEELKKLTAKYKTELWTKKEVCEFLNITSKTYQKYVKAEKFEQLKPGSGKNARVYVRRSEVEQLRKDGKI